MIVTDHGNFVVQANAAVKFTEDDVSDDQFPGKPLLLYNLEARQYLLHEHESGSTSSVVTWVNGAWEFTTVNTDDLYCNAPLHQIDITSILELLLPRASMNKVCVRGKPKCRYGQLRRLTFNVVNGPGYGQPQVFSHPLDAKGMDPDILVAYHLSCRTYIKNSREASILTGTDDETRYCAYGDQVLGLRVEYIPLPNGVDSKAECVYFLQSHLPKEVKYVESVLNKEACIRPGLGICLFWFDRKRGRVYYAYNRLVQYESVDGQTIFTRQQLNELGLPFVQQPDFPKDTTVTDQGKLVLVAEDGQAGPVFRNPKDLVYVKRSHPHWCTTGTLPFRMCIDGVLYEPGRPYHFALGPGAISADWKQLGLTPDGKAVFISHISPEYMSKPHYGGIKEGPLIPVPDIAPIPRMLTASKEQLIAAENRAAAAEQQSKNDRRKRRKLEGQLKNVTKQAQEAMKSANQATIEVREKQYMDLTARVKRAKAFYKLAKKPNGKAMVGKELERQAKDLEQNGDEKGAQDLRERAEMYQQLSVAMIRQDTLRAQEELVEQAKRTKQFNDEAEAAQAHRVSHWKFEEDSDSEDGGSPMDVDDNLDQHLSMPADPDVAGPATGLGSRPPPASAPDLTRAFSGTPPLDSTGLTGVIVELTPQDVEELEEELENDDDAPEEQPRRSLRSSNNK